MQQNETPDFKRMLIAFGLSAAVLVLWFVVFPPEEPAPTPTTADQTTQGDGSAAGSTEASTAATSTAAALGGQTEFTPGTGVPVEVYTPGYILKLDSTGGVATEQTLLRYKRSIDPASQDIRLVTNAAAAKRPLGLIINDAPTWSAAQWSYDGPDTLMLDAGEEGSVVFTGAMGPLRITRELTFSADSYLVRELVTLTNTAEVGQPVDAQFTMAGTQLTDPDDAYNLTRLEWLQDGSLDDEGDTSDLAETGVTTPTEDGPLQWGALRSNYFIMALVPSAPQSVFKALYVDNVYRMAVAAPRQTVAPGGATTLEMAYYLGPIKDDYLEGMPNQLEEAVNFGFFDLVAKPLLYVLRLCHEVTHNWGLAIILLTVMIKIVFWPLTQKSLKSMQAMKKLQPMMEKIREKHKDDKQKMQQEIMQLYKTHKVNPLGGCMPMVMQIPVFLGLYNVLLSSLELRHASFIEYLPGTDMIWLADLSAADPFYITPIVMGASMFLQQKMTPTPGDPMQAKIMLMLPIFFTFIFLSFPAGLVIYWLVNNILSIFQQWLVLRKS